MSERLAIYAEGQFETLNGKTGHGVIRYAPREIVAVVDSATAGRRGRRGRAVLRPPGADRGDGGRRPPSSARTGC